MDDFTLCVYVYVLVCVNLGACVCVHAAKLGAYRDHVFFPSVSIEVSGKELDTPHVLNPWQGADTAATQEAPEPPLPMSRGMAQEGEAQRPGGSRRGGPREVQVAVSSGLDVLLPPHRWILMMPTLPCEVLHEEEGSGSHSSV